MKCFRSASIDISPQYARHWAHQAAVPSSRNTIDTFNPCMLPHLLSRTSHFNPALSLRWNWIDCQKYFLWNPYLLPIPSHSSRGSEWNHWKCDWFRSGHQEVRMRDCALGARYSLFGFGICVEWLYLPCVDSPSVGTRVCLCSALLLIWYWRASVCASERQAFFNIHFEVTYSHSKRPNIQLPLSFRRAKREPNRSRVETHKTFNLVSIFFGSNFCFPS